VSAWVLPFTVYAFGDVTVDDVAELVGVPVADVQLVEPIVGVRVVDGDGDPMCDLAMEGCVCPSCVEGLLCGAAVERLLLAVQVELVAMGARPIEPVRWQTPPPSERAIAELRSPDRVVH
jgi:hypothetical protein